MLGVIFGLLVVTALTVHYVLVERPRQRAQRLEGPHPIPLALADIIGKVPEGVFLQPTLTWGRLRPDGDVELGIHPLLLGLAGPSRAVNPCAGPGRIEKGQPIAEIAAGEGQLSVRSPASGRIVETNPRIAADSSWRGATLDDGSWVCRVRPDRLSDEIGSWLIADKAVEWTRRRYGDIRDSMLALAFRGEPELMLADGGEIPVGILTQLDGASWLQFEKDFLDPTS
ncbi:MAG: hypothetical protein P8Y07_04460 [Gemmatimonadales bacterium]|jgi:glycine cleavage system H lipoate-binding protein